MRPFALVPSLLALVAALCVPVAASAATPIDPSSLVPPPPSTFTVTCAANGATTVCTGSELQTYVDADMGGGGFACDGTSIIDNGSQTRTGRFEYDAAGRATRWLVHGEFTETWHLDGVEAPELHTLGHWSVDNDFVIPGDITSRTRAYRGQNLLVTGPRGMVATTSGLLVTDWNEANILALHGRQTIVTDFDAFIGAVCDAFGR